jgi:HEAT repeat protein
MSHSKLSTALATIVVAAVFLPMAVGADAIDPAALDKAFETLKAYDWGQDRGPLQVLETAVAAAHADATAQKNLETRLVAVLKSDAPKAAKDVVCRQLSLIGSADAVPALADLLLDKELSHMGRYALERIPAAEAVAALRTALPKAEGLVKVGVINSLGVRRDAESLAALVALLRDSNQEIATASAAALGAIGVPEAAKALEDFQKEAPTHLRLAVADASLACAERLLSDGKKPEAMAIYKALSTQDMPKHVKLAAVRGMLAVTGQK